jgi:hypothetical protein
MCKMRYVEHDARVAYCERSTLSALDVERVAADVLTSDLVSAADIWLVLESLKTVSVA